MRTLAEYVRTCPGCNQPRGLSQFRRVAGVRMDRCRSCEAPAPTSELAALNTSIRVLKGRLSRLEKQRTELRRSA